MNKVKFIVFDKSGRNVTNDRDWYISISGELYYISKDNNDKITLATSDYYYVVSK